ncbi:MAG: MBL fold metallo-hydrolase [Calditrichaeota bacterium]|nr:MBL fold metallo-hydrolase [Calditrichota bacterium]
MLKIQSWTVGFVETNTYLIWCSETREAALVDPGGDTEHILNFAKKNGLAIRYIINTHGHADHIAENSLAKERTGAPLLIHEADRPMLMNPELNFSLAFGLPVVSPDADGLLREGDSIALGKLALSILHTPGHSPGSISLVYDKVVIVGDTLFCRSVGRTDLPGGSVRQLEASIRKKLYKLPADTIVYTGHGPTTTIGEERRENPFVRG